MNGEVKGAQKRAKRELKESSRKSIHLEEEELEPCPIGACLSMIKFKQNCVLKKL